LARGRYSEVALRADPFAQLALLDLQAADSRLDRLAHLRARLPELAELDRLADARSELDGQRIRLQTAVSDLSAAQRKADADVEQVRSRRARNQQRLDSGQVGSARDLENLQHEVVSLDRRIATLEDEELEVMEDLEAAETELATIQGRIAELSERVAAAEQTRDRAFRELDGERTEVTAERDRLAATVSDDLKALYDRLRMTMGGVAAAPLVQRRCEGCRLELNGADIRQIKATAPDEVLRCPECNRILVRTLDSGV
jgi:predicted  nucleic acid-binding Zn-ribbon protein